MKKEGSIFPGDLSMDDEQAKFKFSQDLAGMIFGGPWVPGGILAVNDALQFDTELPPTEIRGVRKGYLGMGALAELKKTGINLTRADVNLSRLGPGGKLPTEGEELGSAAKGRVSVPVSRTSRSRTSRGAR